MNVLEVLEVLLRAGVLVGLDRRGALVVANVPPALERAVEAWRIPLAWAVFTRRRGAGRWRICSHCRRAVISPRARRCPAKPGCKGELIVPEPRPPLELDGAPVPCVRPGCSSPAAWVTAHLEAVCHADYVALALIDPEVSR